MSCLVALDLSNHSVVTSMATVFNVTPRNERDVTGPSTFSNANWTLRILHICLKRQPTRDKMSRLVAKGLSNHSVTTKVI